MRVRFLYDTKENKNWNQQDLNSLTWREAGGYYHDGWQRFQPYHMKPKTKAWFQRVCCNEELPNYLPTCVVGLIASHIKADPPHNEPPYEDEE